MSFFYFRLRCLVKQLERGEASVVDLKKNLEYAASVLESVYIEETRWAQHMHCEFLLVFSFGKY